MPPHFVHLAEALSVQEKVVDKHPTFSKEERAQGYTCLAYDWYDIDLEEEGNRLLLKAEAICPGYFKQTINQQTEVNPGFAFLVERLTAKIVTLVAANLKVK